MEIDRIYSELRRRIVDRSLPPGTKLVASTLSKEFQVSRTPVREVLRRLESEGLVSSYEQKGFSVNPITISDIRQLYTIRISLERLVGKLATPIISTVHEKSQVLERLCGEMKDLSEKGDIEGYGIRNNAFHSQIWGATENKWLIRILENINSQTSRFIVTVLHLPTRMERSLREHWDIYATLKGGDQKRAERLLGRHFENALDDIKTELMD